MIIFLSIVGISRGTAAINSYGLGLGLVEVILSVKTSRSKGRDKSAK